MSQTPFEPLALPHFEDRDAPMLYVDGCLGGAPMMGDNVTLTFGAKFLDHTQSPPAAYSKTVLRLVLPGASAAATADFIQAMLAGFDDAAPLVATGADVN